MAPPCEYCGQDAAFAAVEMVARPASGGNGETNVLRHHLLCALHSSKFDEAFLIAGMGLDEANAVS